jgi:ABC-2 type transport system permease protein
MSLFISTFNTDEFFHWEAYVLTGPLSKRDLVKGKYMLMLMLMGGAFLLALAGELVICAVTKLPMAENLAAGFAMIIYIFLMISIVIPLIYKFGSEKARNSMILIFVVPSLAFVFIGKLIGDERLNAFMENLNWTGVAVGAVILCIVAVIISYFVSIKIIEKKEF